MSSASTVDGRQGRELRTTPWSTSRGRRSHRSSRRSRTRSRRPDTPFGPKDQWRLTSSDWPAAFADVADGLQHAHSKGVVHRDIKPSNLILDGEGKLRILDFGLARLEGQESLTLSGDLMGTVLYMSPEQAMAKRIPLDHRTDVYSLGATMYEVLTGQPPFKGKDQHDTLSQIIVREPRPPRQLNSRVPNGPRDDRAQMPAEGLGATVTARPRRWRKDLRRFVRGDPIEARPEGLGERLVRRAYRHRIAIAAGCCSGPCRPWRSSHTA